MSDDVPTSSALMRLARPILIPPRQGFHVVPAPAPVGQADYRLYASYMTHRQQYRAEVICFGDGFQARVIDEDCRWPAEREVWRDPTIRPSAQDALSAACAYAEWRLCGADRVYVVGFRRGW